MPDQAYQSGLGSLFGGISQGFFDYGRSEEEKARANEDRTRSESLKVLTGLLDDATPETRPVLLKQIGDVMGIKGKHRTVWDRLTGRGLDDTSDQIQTRFQNILSNVVPQEEFEKLRKTPIEGALPAPAYQGPLGAPVYQQPTQDLSGGKIALRNPQAEALEKLKSQYELRSSADQEKFRLAEEQRQQGRVELEKLKSQNTLDRDKQKTLDLAQKEIFARASTMPGGLSNPNNIERAKKAALKNYDLKEDELEARIGYLGAKSKEANANAAALSSSGVPGAKPLEVAKFGEQQASRYDPIFQRYNTASSKASAIQAQIKRINEQAQAIAAGVPGGATFDPKSGQVKNADGTTNMMGTYQAGKLMKTLPKLQQELDQVRSEAEGYAGQLRKAPNYYEEKNGVITPREPAPVGTFRTDTNTAGQTLPLNRGKRGNMVTAAVGDSLPVEDDGQPHRPGDIFEPGDGSQWQYVKPIAGGKGPNKRWMMKRIK
jgi:hypothetical protein